MTTTTTTTTEEVEENRAPSASYREPSAGLLLGDDKKLPQFVCVDVTLKIDMIAHDADKPCYVKLFMQRSLHGFSELQPFFRGRLSRTIEGAHFWLPRFFPVNARIHIWIYGQRRTRGDHAADIESDRNESSAATATAGRYTANERIDESKLGFRNAQCRIGMCNILVLDAMDAVDRKSSLRIDDLNGMAAGTATFELPPESIKQIQLLTHFTNTDSQHNSKHKIAMDRVGIDDKAMDVYRATIDKMYATTADFKESNLTSLLPRRTTVDIPVPGGFRVPMWSLPWMLVQRPTHHRNEDMEVTLRYLLVCACSALNITRQSLAERDVQYTLLAEVIAEMQLFACRASIYVADSVLHPKGERTTLDEWEYLSDQPDPLHRKIDCEDGAINIVEWSMALANVVTDDPILRKLQEIERRYTTMMCLASLRVSGVNTSGACYHVFVLKRDRADTERALLLPSLQKPSSKTAGDNKQPLLQQSGFMPPVLADSTVYSTSCWEYRSKQINPSLDVNSTILEPIENIPKIQPASTLRADLYDCVQAVIVPEWTERYRIGQIELTSNGKLGVSVRTMMLNQSLSTAVSGGLKTYPTTVSSELFQYIYNVFNHTPVTPVLTVSDMKSSNWFNTQRSVEEHEKRMRDSAAVIGFSAWYRTIDLQTVTVQTALKQRLLELGLSADYVQIPFDLGDLGQLVRVIQYE